MDQLGKRVTLMGRVMGVRQVGKIKFLDVMRDHHVTQLTTTCMDPVRRGDIISAEGDECKTRDGHIGVKAGEFKIVKAFCGTHFPDHKMGESECERHIDLLANQNSNIIFRQRAKIIQHLRQFFTSRQFVEVETPILSFNANGATARPFSTKAFDDRELFLRIAPELYLKRLIVGGFDKVFEIGKVFRNEGIDSTHNPEFTSLEAYQSFATFDDLIDVVNEIFDGCDSTGSLRIKQKIDIMYVLKANRIHIDFQNDIRPQLEHFTKLHDIYEPKKTVSKLFDRLVGKFVEPLCKEPTILTGFPLFTSPLAAANLSNPLMADRLEVFVDGKEVANGYQELTDTEEQQRRFELQRQERCDTSDLETPLPDADYVEALRLGMPPTIGLGIGIDRLVMLLCKRRSIKDVIFFPQ